MLPSSSSNLPLVQLKLSSITLPFVLLTQGFVWQCHEEVGKAELQHFVSCIIMLHRYKYSSRESFHFAAKIA